MHILEDNIYMIAQHYAGYTAIDIVKHAMHRLEGNIYLIALHYTACSAIDIVKHAMHRCADYRAICI